MKDDFFAIYGVKIERMHDCHSYFYDQIEKIPIPGPIYDVLKKAVEKYFEGSLIVNKEANE